MDEYEKTPSSVIGVQIVSDDETHRYGIIDPSNQSGRRYEVCNFVEKPEQGTAPSNLAIIGRYVFTPEIIYVFGKKEKGAGGEIQLTDAIQKLNEIQRVFAYAFEGKRYDVGEKLGFILTTIEFALKDETLKDKVVNYLDDLMEKQKI